MKHVQDYPLRASLVAAMAEASAHEEGFYVTEAQAKARKIKWPTLAQMNNNPVNLRMWGSHPQRYGFVHFLPDVQKGQPLPATHPGWKAARRQYERCIFERHLTFYTLYAGQRNAKGELLPGGYPGFAPAADKNNPEQYAINVLARLKESWEPLASKAQAEKDKITIHTVIETLAR